MPSRRHRREAARAASHSRRLISSDTKREHRIRRCRVAAAAVPARGADMPMELPIGDLRNQRRSGARRGTVKVVKGNSSAQKTGIAHTTTRLVLATIQRNVASVYVQGVTLVAGSSGSFPIHLIKPVPRASERPGSLLTEPEGALSWAGIRFATHDGRPVRSRTRPGPHQRWPGCVGPRSTRQAGGFAPRMALSPC